MRRTLHHCFSVYQGTAGTIWYSLVEGSLKRSTGERDGSAARDKFASGT